MLNKRCAERIDNHEDGFGIVGTVAAKVFSAIEFIFVTQLGYYIRDSWD